MDVLNMMKNKRPSSISRNTEIVKLFAKFTIDINYQLKDRKIFKNEKEWSELLKLKIIEYVKIQLKDKGIKNDLRSFFLLLLYELNRLISNLIGELDISKTQFTEEKILSNLKLNYEFNDQLMITSEEVYSKIMLNKMDYSYIIYLLISLSYIKVCDMNELIFEKDFDLSDISIKIVNILCLYHKLFSYSQNLENLYLFNLVKKCLNDILPYYLKLLNEILDDPELKSVVILIEEDYFSIMFNVLGEIKIIRKFLYELYIKLNLFVKDGIKIRMIKRNFIDNKCLEGILSNLKKNYSYKNYETVLDIFNELIYLFLITITFYDTDIIGEIKLEVFNFFLKLFEDLNLTTENLDDFMKTAGKFIQEIFNLSLIDKEEVKNKFMIKTEFNNNFYSNSSIFKDPQVLEFLLDLFEFFNETIKYENNFKFPITSNKIIERSDYLRKTIFRSLLDNDSSLIRYKYLVINTSFCEKIFENLCNFSEEMISYPLSSLLIIMSDLSTDKNYIPEKEFRSILKTICECNDEEKMKIILKNFKSFIDMSANNNKLLVQCGFFSKVVDILKYLILIISKTITNLESKIYPCLSAEVLLLLMNILNQILNGNQQYITAFKNYQLLENFFERFISHSDYLNLAYKIWSVCIVNEIEFKEIIKQSKFLLKRYYFLKEKLKIITTWKDLKLITIEFYRIYEILQVITQNENFVKICSYNYELSNNFSLKNILTDLTDLLEIIKSSVNLIIKNQDMENNTKENNIEERKIEFALDDINFFGFIKNYFKILYIIVVNGNNNIIREKLKSIKLETHTRKKGFKFLINKKEIKNIIINMFLFIREYNIFLTIYDFLKISLEISLHFNENIFSNEFSPRKSSQQSLLSFLMEKIKLNSKINDYNSLGPNISTILIENPLLIKYCVISLIKVQDIIMIKDFLECIELLMKLNVYNIKVMLSHNLIKYLLQIMNLSKDSLNNKVLDIIEISCYYFSSSILEEIFIFILLNIKKNDINLKSILDIVSHSYYNSRKIINGIVLSNYLSKQPDLFNIVYTGNIKFNFLKYNSYKKTTSISIVICLSYKNYEYISKNEAFILFRFEKEDKNKDIVALEATLENNLLCIKENEKEVFSSTEHLDLIKSGKIVNFLFVLNKDSNSIDILINEKIINSLQTELKYLDFNSNYNLITGFNGNALKEMPSEIYQVLPYVKLSYFMIYSDKITSDKLIYFKLSKIYNSKNGSCRSQKINLKYLSKKKYKMFATNNINDLLKSINLQIDPNKVIFELVVDKLNLLSNNQLQKSKNELIIQTNFLSKLQRRYSIDLIEKFYVIFIKNTNYSADYLNFFSHSYLVSKNNYTNLMASHNIYEFNNVKNELLQVMYYDHSIDLSISTIRFTELIFTLLNDCEDINIFYSLFKLLISYLLSHIYSLTHFCESDDFKMLLTIIYKKKKFVNETMIDYIISLSFGLENLEGITFFNPLFPKILSDLLLDFNFFKIISSDIKLYILMKIKTFFNPNEFFFIMYESNFEIKVDTLNKLYKFLLLIEVDKTVNDELIYLVILLLEQSLKLKKGEIEPSDNQLERITNFTQEFFLVSGYFDEISISHLKYKRKENDESTKHYVKHNFNKLYSNEIKLIREEILEHFTKIFEELTNKKNQSVYNSKVQNFLNPAFFLKLYNKEIRQKTPKSKESLSKINMKIIQNISYSDEFSTSIDHSTNLSKTSKSPIILKNPSGKEMKFTYHVRSESTYPTKKNSDKSIFSSKMADDFVFITESNENSIKNKGKFMGEIYFGDNDQECANQSCQICTFIKEYMGKILINIIKNYLTYKKILDKSFKYIFLKDKPFSKDILLSKSFVYSWYLQKSEGPARIRNKLKAKLDTIRNEELSKKYYESFDINKCQELNEKKIRSNFNKVFEIDEIHDVINNIFFIDQIFNINIVKQFIDNNDTFITALNCLIVKDLFHQDCVIIIGTKKVYILTNVHINKEKNILEAKTKFKKFFWVVSDYKDELDRCCCYLSDYYEENSTLLENIDFEEIHSNQSKRRKINDKLKMHKFLRDQNEYRIIKFEFKDINEIHKRRYLLKQNSLEIFLKNGRNYFIVFNADKREAVFQLIVKNTIQNDNKKSLYSNLNPLFNNSPSQFFIRNTKLIIKKTKGKLTKSDRGLVDAKQLIEEIQENWSKGIISNYDYLIILNMFSGRSFNDISQYFIIPWILKDYSSEGLNLNTSEIYRDLSRPIHAIDDKNFKKLIQKYTESEESDKFHSGSHYSTPGFVSYFLVRLKPFSFISVEIQGGYFDVADRIFNNIKGLWEIPDKYQELIPEMYYLPEIFVNFNEFDFGENQTHSKINDIMLPNWAKNEPRIFVKMNKKALESSKVSEKINDWIDLIFGCKQKGKEAIKSLNIFRTLCYEGKLDLDIIDDREKEDKLIEINDFGQIPIQLFLKPHIKKECHQKSYAFFSKPSYLINFVMKDKIFLIDLKSKPKNIMGYYECPDTYLSQGQGGLTSFYLYHDINEKISKSVNSYNTFFIVGKNKALLGPNFKNYIDWSEDKFSINIVKPLKKICFTFPTLREVGIKIVKPSRDGKKLIICYDDGFIELYGIHKQKMDSTDTSGLEKKSIFKLIVNKFKDSPKNINTNAVKIRSDRIYPEIKQLNDNQINDYFIHYNSNLEFTKSSKINSTFNLKKLSEKKIIYNEITTLEICQAFSLLVIIDSKNFIYLFDLNKFEIIRQINLREIIKSREKFFLISICNLSGEFVCFSQNQVVLFNINGVIIGLLDLKIHKNYYPITTGALKSVNSILIKLKTTQTELFLFTGHHDGIIIMWRLTLNNNFKYNLQQNKEYTNLTKLDSNEKNTFIIDSYRMAYNPKFYTENVKKTFEFKYNFDEPFEFSKKINSPVRIIKLSEDNSFLMILHDNLNLCYWSYSEFMMKIVKSKQEKECHQCNNHINSSKYDCSLCKKKLCAQCKIIEIVPEISLKNTSSVCNDCLSIICSTNKMLYDFA